MDKDAFSKHKLGLPDIDNQHWALCENLDKVRFNKNCKSKGEYIKLIEDLKNAILFHFNYEEKLMQEIKFPFFITHKQEHDKLAATVVDMLSELKANPKVSEFTFHLKLIDALEKAIVYHMDNFDTQIGYFVNWKNKKR